MTFDGVTAVTLLPGQEKAEGQGLRLREYVRLSAAKERLDLDLDPSNRSMYLEMITELRIWKSADGKITFIYLVTQKIV